jgi:hypothetical protein
VTRYKVEEKTSTALFAAYVHDPEDIVASTQDYLEDMWGDGWELAGTLSIGSALWRFIFKANGQP